MNIRLAATRDYDQVKSVYLCAFPESERDTVAKLAIDLLNEITNPKIISLVAESKDEIVGHVAFSPVKIENNEKLQGYILAPLGVKPDYQRRRIGSNLIENGMHRLSALGINVVFVYGDPKYYNRFGFSADTAHRYTAPYKIRYPFGWQAIELSVCNMEKPFSAITCVTSLRDPKLW